MLPSWLSQQEKAAARRAAEEGEYWTSRMDPAYNDVLPHAARSRARSKVASCIKVVDPVKLGRTPERLHTARPELTRSPARSIPHENYAAEAKAAAEREALAEAEVARLKAEASSAAEAEAAT